MKLRTLSRINTVISFAIVIVMLPFAIIHIILHYAAVPFEFIYSDLLNSLRKCIGNKLLHLSDEAKAGIIKSKHQLRYGTASSCYKEMNQYK